MEKYVLKKPIQHNGETIKELNMDFDNLSRADMDKAEAIARAKLGKKANIVGVWALNKEYQMCVASIASGVSLPTLDNLGGKDYVQIGLVVQNFLLDGDSEDEEANRMMEEYLRESGKTSGTSTSPQETLTNLPSEDVTSGSY